MFLRFTVIENEKSSDHSINISDTVTIKEFLSDLKSKYGKGQFYAFDRKLSESFDETIKKYYDDLANLTNSSVNYEGLNKSMLNLYVIDSIES